MGATTTSVGSVSSPAATGGAGTFFEQHVDAYWLALLLVRGSRLCKSPAYALKY
jgi:hypothetical protein